MVVSKVSIKCIKTTYSNLLSSSTMLCIFVLRLLYYCSVVGVVGVHLCYRNRSNVFFIFAATTVSKLFILTNRDYMINKFGKVLDHCFPKFTVLSGTRE